MSEETANWSELEKVFGVDAVAVIDRAIAEHLSQIVGDIKPSEHYLVSEGLAYAVLTAMRDHGLRFGRVVTKLRGQTA